MPSCITRRRSLNRPVSRPPILYAQSVWVGLVNLVFTLLSMAVVDKLGRRPLLIIGSICMGLCLLYVGYGFHTKATGMGLLFGVLGYVASFAFSMGVVGWVVISEIYPTRTRGRAMAVATAGVWGACYLVSQTFPMLRDRAGLDVTFWIYALLCAVALGFVLVFIPETKGRSLEEIETWWSRRGT